MLSAIAARKAAEAARVAALSSTECTANVAPPQRAILSHQNSDSETDDLQNILRPQRRKPAPGDASGRKGKKRKKGVHIEYARPRYFQLPVEEDAFEIQDDVIIVDSGIEDDAHTDTDEDRTGAMGNEVEDHKAVLSDAENIYPYRGRPWSPNQPPPGLSEEQNSDENTSRFDLLSIPAASHLQCNDAPPLITTFSPSMGKNIFYLDGSEVSQMTGDTQDHARGTIVTLSPGETIALTGTYALSVLRGRISLSGVDLSISSTSHPVFVPQCTPIPVITALVGLPSVASSVTPSYLKLPESITRHIDTEMTVIFFQAMRTGVEGLGRVCRTIEGAFDPVEENDTLQLESARIMFRLTSHLQIYSLPPSWLSALSSLPTWDVHGSPENPDREDFASQPLVALIKGPKRSGKSTFARTLLNRLTTSYRRVAFLECDLGQTEFTPPGMVALNIIEQPVFGPPFSHPTIPFQAHFIGSTSPRASPSHYLGAIQSLLHSYRLDLQFSESQPSHDPDAYVDNRISDVVPLVVNTMGWTKGLGADISRRIEAMLEPTHVFTFLESESFPSEQVAWSAVPRSQRRSAPTTAADASPGALSFELEPIPSSPLTARYTAADWRTISLMSYFHSQLPLPHPLPASGAYHTSTRTPHSPLRPRTATWDTALPLLARPPYAVSPRLAFDSIVLTGPDSEDVVVAEIGRVLNGALVALVSGETGAEDSPSLPDADDNRPLRYIPGGPPPDPQTSSCLGLALIRAVAPSVISPHPHAPGDATGPEADALHILTPLPAPLLASARCIVKGEIELPIWGMLDWREFERSGRKDKGQEHASVPYLQWSRGEGLGADRRRVRRDLMRRAQM